MNKNYLTKSPVNCNWWRPGETLRHFRYHADWTRFMHFYGTFCSLIEEATDVVSGDVVEDVGLNNHSAVLGQTVFEIFAPLTSFQRQTTER